MTQQAVAQQMRLSKGEDKVKLTGNYISKDSLIHSTGKIKYSPQKLNMIARQIKGLPVGEAIAQMKFSVKKPAPKIMHTLKELIRQAKLKRFGNSEKSDRSLVIAQAWVGKDIYEHGIIFHGRGRFGRMTRPYSHMKIMVKHSEVPLAPNRGNRIDGKGGFLPPKKERRNVKLILPERPIINKSKRLFFDA
jgi:large subunit ribosomal protein L22